MANDREIIIKISADGSAAIAGIRGVGDSTEALGKRTLSTTESLKKNWLEVTAGITAAYFALQKTWQWMESAAQTQEAFETLESLTAQYNITAEEMARTVSRASQGLIGMGSAAKLATDAIAKGLTPEQLENIARWAPTVDDLSTSIHGSREAFEALATAIATGRERSLVKLLGASIDLKEETDGLSEKMSKAEKSAALYRMAMERLEPILKATGNEQNSAADRMERFNNQLDQAKFFVGQLAIVVGGPFMAVFQAAGAFVYGLVGGIIGLGASVATVTDELGITEGKAAGLWKRSEDWLQRSADSAVAAKNNLAGALEQLKMIGQYSSGMAARGKVDLGLGGAEGQAEDLAKGYAKMIGALSKYHADSEAFRKAEQVSEQQAFDSRLGLKRAELAAVKAMEEQGDADAQARRDLILAMKRQEWAEEREARQKQIEMDRFAFEDKVRAFQEARDAMMDSSSNAPFGAAQFGAGLMDLAEISAGVDPMAQRVEQMRVHYEQLAELHRQNRATIEEVEAAHNAWMGAAQLNAGTEQLRIAGANANLMIGILQLANTLTQGKYKELFFVIRGMQAAQAIISGHVAAAAALTPPPVGLGPVAGIPLAGIVKAMGYVNAAAIMAQGFMATGGGGGGGSVPSLGALPPSSSSQSSEQQKSVAASPVINVHLYGDTLVDQTALDDFARRIAPSITKAYADGVR